MNLEIKVPSMGESISEAIIGKIIAVSGTVVKADEELLELETDKVNQVLYAPQAGIFTLTVTTGDTVKIGQTIGLIQTDLTSNTEKKSSPSALELPSFSQDKSISPATSSVDSHEGTLRYGKDQLLKELENSTQTTINEPSPILADPKELLSYQDDNRKETRRPMSRIRKVIAQRLVEAQQTMAMLTTFNEVDLTSIIQLREKYQEAFTKKYGCKLGYMSFFVKAVVAALQSFPELNSFIDGEDIVHREYYDIGVAVGTEKGVIVPVIRQCDRLSYAEIELFLENYAKKAREGSLSVQDLQGGGFTITNGGVYGSLLSTPILLSPQCAILGMHKIEKRPVVINDQITIRSMMYLALSYDHRLIDGKEAVSFLVKVKNMLEDSSRLLLEI